MAGRTAQGLIDVLEGNYGGDVAKMPYVVNKEAFGKLQKSHGRNLDKSVGANASVAQFNTSITRCVQNF